MNTPENNHLDDRHPDMPAIQSPDCIPTGFDSMCSLRGRGVIQGGICDRHDFLQTNTSKHPGTDIPQTTVFHICRQDVNDLSSDPKPSYIMRDSPMKPMIINVNVHTSSIIQTAKTHLAQVSITPLLRLRCEHADTTICSHFHISSRNKNEPCANLRFRHSSSRFRNGSSPAG